jgi:Tol biopolymer transport system component
MGIDIMSADAGKKALRFRPPLAQRVGAHANRLRASRRLEVTARILAGLAVAFALVASPAAAGRTTERLSSEHLAIGEDDFLQDAGRVNAAVTPDGRFVAFGSHASDIVPGDTNGQEDVFVRDRATGATERVSVPDGGGEADGASLDPAISADGRFVAFRSSASNLVSGDTFPWDVFVHDRATGATEKVTPEQAGSRVESPPAISGDGRFVAFAILTSHTGADGLAFAHDVFVRDRASGDLELVSVARDGGEADGWSFGPAISADGRVVAFSSFASNLASGDDGRGGVFVRDRDAGITERVGASAPGGPSISADGRFVAFYSFWPEVPGDGNDTGDVFVRDLETGATELVSVANDGAQGNGASLLPAISADGRFVAFASDASNLVPGDRNPESDVFVRDRTTGSTELVSERQEAHINGWPAISADGRFVAFRSGKLIGHDEEMGQAVYSWELFLSARVGAPPAPSTPDLAASSDTGDSDTDERTNDRTPTFTGTALEGTTVTILVDGAEKGSATATAGAYSITTGPLPEGRHSITATATDAVGTPSGPSAALEVTIDTTAPDLTVPATIRVDATSPDGALVTYTTSAQDALDGPRSPNCNPPSQRTFPIGTTTVACTATDAAGNVAEKSFAVVVLSARQQIADLTEVVAALRGMPRGTQASLLSKLQAAQAAFSANRRSACGSLRALRNQVEALAGRKLTVEQADRLLDDLARIRAAGGCRGPGRQQLSGWHGRSIGPPRTAGPARR